MFATEKLLPIEEAFAAEPVGLAKWFNDRLLAFVLLFKAIDEEEEDVEEEEDDDESLLFPLLLLLLVILCENPTREIKDSLI